MLYMRCINNEFITICIRKKKNCKMYKKVNVQVNDNIKIKFMLCKIILPLLPSDKFIFCLL